MLYFKIIIAAFFLLFGAAPAYSQPSALEIDSLAAFIISAFNLEGMAVGGEKTGKLFIPRDMG